MSYVIQNFYQPTQDITFNPRLKLLIYCQNITKLFLFFRFNLTMFNLNFFLTLLPASNLILYQSYFLKHVDSFDYIFSLKLTANHTIKLHKSLSLYGLSTLHTFFLSGRTSFLNIPIEEVWFCNIPYFTIKIIKFPIVKKFYKNVFLFLLLSSVFQWHAHTNKISFYSMFFFVFGNLKLNKFYNRKFFKVFNV